ncbi:MAG: hypothetical protein MRZ79_02290 [Bacteroidia bacterium]|nr:hypothetical protein [Bacteroidia bacterium]
MKFSLILAGFFLINSIPFLLYGQEEEKTYSQSFTAGLMTSNRGAGLELGYQAGAGKWQKTFNLDFFFVRSLHEVKVEPYPFPDRKYVFGKVNNFWVLTPSFGMQYHLGQNSSFNLVDMRLGAKLGPAIGITNPYFIKLCGVNGSCVETPFNPDIHSYQTISGRANLLNNRVDPTFRLGISLKAYSSLDFNSRAGTISGLRFGLNADIFPNEIPIMLENDDLNNQSTFFSASVGLIFGGNW